MRSQTNYRLRICQFQPLLYHWQERFRDNFNRITTCAHDLRFKIRIFSQGTTRHTIHAFLLILKDVKILHLATESNLTVLHRHNGHFSTTFYSPSLRVARIPLLAMSRSAVVQFVHVEPPPIRFAHDLTNQRRLCGHDSPRLLSSSTKNLRMLDFFLHRIGP